MSTSKFKKLISRAVIMSSDTKEVLDGYDIDIREIKEMIIRLDKKIDGHIRDDALDVASIKAHLAEAVNLMKEALDR